jgi:ribose transport system substrate-binding protein
MMIILGKRIAFVLLAGPLALLTGCTRHSKDEHYYLIATNTKVPYWQTAGTGFTTAAAQYGVTAELRGPDGFDPEAEVQEFRSMVARKPAGILVSVADAKLMTPEIDAAVAAGIPVITVDSDAPQSHRLYFIGTNNLEAGRLGGNHLATALKGKGNVVFFSNPGQPNLDERLKGYKDILSTYPGIKVVDVFDIKGDSGNAMDKAREYLALTGPQRIDAMVCLESASGRDVAEAFKRTHAEGRVLIAMDLDQGTLELVKDGTIDSTISQKPYTMGLLGLKALDEVHHSPVKSQGENYSLDPFAPFPAFVDTGVSLVDKTNVDSILAREQAASK